MITPVLSVLRSQQFWTGQAFALGAVLAATMLRQIMSPLVQDEMPHIPYLAAILIVAWRSGLAAGLMATALSAFAVNWVFIGDYGQFSSEADDLWATSFFILFAAAMAWLPARLAASIRREIELTARLALVNGELQHRIGNIVTVVQSVLRQSARNTSSAAELKDKVEERLNAMSHALRLLNLTDEAVPLRALVKDVLEPFRMEGTLSLGGPDVSIPGEVALQLALMLHELGTNAVKHGALSVPTGAVHLSWEDVGSTTHLRWHEKGGPPVKKPTRAGFGSRLIRAALPNGETSIDYHVKGVICLMQVPTHSRPGQT